MEPDKFALRRARYEFFGLVEGCVISGLEGVAKPDQKIFEILMSRYGLTPAATVFIDDLPANVAAARELGVVAIKFTTAAQLRSDLRDLGLRGRPVPRLLLRALPALVSFMTWKPPRSLPLTLAPLSR